MAAILSGLSALVAVVMAIALLDQWRERRRPYQLAWAIGSLLFGVAAAAEALGAASGWSPELFKAWYLAGAVLNAAWFGLGTAYLLGRTRFGYAYAVLLALGGIFTVLSQAKNHYEGVGSLPILYLIFRGSPPREFPRSPSSARSWSSRPRSPPVPWPSMFTAFRCSTPCPAASVSSRPS